MRNNGQDVQRLIQSNRLIGDAERHVSTGNLVLAERQYRASLNLAPNSIAGNFGLAALLIQTGKFSNEILKRLRRAKTFANAKQIKGIDKVLCEELLRAEQFVEGWQLYSGLPGRFSERPEKGDVWNGEDLSDKSVIAFGEQGTGDFILFASMIPDLARTAGSVTIVTSDRLLSLFQRSFQGVTVTDNILIDVAADYQIAFGDMGRAFRKAGSDFIGAPYLKADKLAVQRARERLCTPGKQLIGLSWLGGKSRQQQQQRSISPRAAAPIFGIPDSCFVSLQHDPNQMDHVERVSDFDIQVRELCSSGMQIDPVLSTSNNVDELASLVAACDLVISIDNSTLNLAGALGARTIGLLPSSPNWRWGISRKTPLWYASVDLIRGIDVNCTSCVAEAVTASQSKR